MRRASHTSGYGNLQLCPPASTSIAATNRLVPPGHEVFDPGDACEVVVDNRHHQHHQDGETSHEHFLFDGVAEVTSRNAFQRHDQNMPTVEHGNRHEVQQAE